MGLIVFFRLTQGLRPGLTYFAPLGLYQLSFIPTVSGVGCILSPLRGWLSG